MTYKSKFRPLERLGPGGWRRFDPEQRMRPWANFSEQGNGGDGDRETCQSEID